MLAMRSDRRLTIPIGAVLTVTGRAVANRACSAGLGPNDSRTAIVVADCANAKVIIRDNELLP